MADSRFFQEESEVGFDVPENWRVELETGSAAFPILVALRARELRIMVAIRVASGASPAARAATMRQDLSFRGITTIAESPSIFPETDVAGLDMLVNGERQRWISIVRHGVEISLTHTGKLEDVEIALREIAATVGLPNSTKTIKFLAEKQTYSPFDEAAELAGLSHFQKIARRFNIPLGPRRRKS